MIPTILDAALHGVILLSPFTNQYRADEFCSIPPEFERGLDWQTKFSSRISDEWQLIRQ